MRIHQWVKNILIFVPLIASHRITEVSLLWDTLFGWGCMSLTASALYILNDLFDLDSDRQHPVKLHRPFAAGEAPLLQGLFLGVILLVSSLAAAWLLPNRFVWVVVTYAIVTMTYTWLLKRQVFLDVLSLSLLFTLRIIGGYEVTGVAYSSWLLALSMFLFLSLALLKRYSELQFRLNRGEVAAFGRDYYVSDIQLVQAFGVSSGYTAALVLALYVDSNQASQHYPHHHILWAWCPLYLYFISRMWMLASRGQMHSDPILFILKDPPTYIILAIAGTALALALRGAPLF